MNEVTEGRGTEAMDVQSSTPADLLGPLNDVETKHAPERLYYAGHLGLLRNGPRVSLIGTRKPTTEGLKRTEVLAKALVAREAIVVSGLAEGVDTAAHRGAIDSGGRTIAVIGTPLDQSYPKSNGELQEKLMKEHLVISQFPSGYPSRPGNFPIRNRTMALISHATVIIEAGQTSGTLHQGWEALRLGRPLFLLQSLTEKEDLEWPQEMISYGAQVLTRDKIDHLFEVLPQGPLSAELPL